MPTDPNPTALLRFGSLVRAAPEGWGEPAEGQLDFLASDDGEDRYRTRLAQDWLDDQRMAAFDLNPVVTAQHATYREPIGNVIKREVRDVEPGRRGLFVRIAWDMDDPESARIAGKYARGVMRTVSVGFQPGRATAFRDLDKGHAWYKDAPGAVLAMNELHEIAAVTVPGNPRAVALRDAQWLQTAIVEAAPADVRAEVIRLLREDSEIAAIVREVQGDLRDKGLASAAPEINAARLFPFTLA